MEKEVVEYLKAFGMSEEKAEQRVQELIEKQELVEFHGNMYVDA